MKFGNYSPPAVPSAENQQDALRKGLGRTMQWALRGLLADEPLLAACLQDQRFDQQVEDLRGEWLWSLIEQTSAVERFRVPILHALYELPDERSAFQICQLSRRYAQLGDEAFRTRLYDIVEQKPISDSPYLGEEELLELDGESGFLFAARVRGERLATMEWDWDDGNPVHEAVERLGEDCITNVLAASAEPGIKRFYETWRAQPERKSTGIPTHRERMRAYAVDDIIQAAQGTGRCYWFRGWGMHADSADLQSILSTIWATESPNVLAQLLRVFSNRPLPEFDSRLIHLCKHDDEETRRWALSALAMNTDASIRPFALEQLSVAASGEVIALFAKNFQSGDEQRLLDALCLLANDCQLHWLLMDVIDVLESNPAADCSQLAIIVYASTPCENCRFHAARLLHKQQVAPEWLIEECRFDAEEDCRELFKGQGQ